MLIPTTYDFSALIWRSVAGRPARRNEFAFMHDRGSKQTVDNYGHRAGSHARRLHQIYARNRLPVADDMEEFEFVCRHHLRPTTSLCSADSFSFGNLA